MKKYIIASLVLVFGFAGGVYAANDFSLAIRLDNKNNGYIKGATLDKEGSTIVKFIDKKTVCYMAITKVNNLPVNTAISCL